MARFSADKRLLVYGLTESYADIFCFSTTRHGGCSTGEYASFNCNHYCGDSPQAVMRNRELLCSLMPRPDALVIPHQTHGTTVRVIDENFVSLPDKEKLSCLESVDALVTNVAGQCLCVSTADCVPVLCYDARRRAVAAIHAGWRGTVARIVEYTLRLMADVYGTDGRDVHACIGPSISPEAFEVGDEVWQAFRDSGFPMGRIAHRCGKWHIDLWEANRLQLLACGVCPENIELSGVCTYGSNEDFFSARRQGVHSGRILSGILLRPLLCQPLE